MSFFQKIGYWLLIGMCKLAGWLPYVVLYYGFVWIIYACLYKIGRYRVKVVRSNLKGAFPDKNDKELRGIEKKFYKNLSEIFIDTFTLCAKKPENLEKRFIFENSAEQERETAGQTWLCAMAHYGSWEYTSTYKMHTGHNVAAVYKPIHSVVFEEFYKYLRGRCGAVPLALNSVAKNIVEVKLKNLPPMALALIADQTPPWHEIHHWFTFLNRPAGFHMGIEKLALRFNLPVYFLHVEKVKRGYYTSRFVEIYNGTDKVEEYEITQRYIAKLEEMIRERPELWLWSHKRWKHKPRTEK